MTQVISNQELNALTSNQATQQNQQQPLTPEQVLGEMTKGFEQTAKNAQIQQQQALQQVQTQTFSDITSLVWTCAGIAIVIGIIFALITPNNKKKGKNRHNKRNRNYK